MFPASTFSNTCWGVKKELDQPQKKWLLALSPSLSLHSLYLLLAPVGGNTGGFGLFSWQLLLQPSLASVLALSSCLALLPPSFCISSCFSEFIHLLVCLKSFPGTNLGPGSGESLWQVTQVPGPSFCFSLTPWQVSVSLSDPGAQLKSPHTYYLPKWVGAAQSWVLNCVLWLHLDLSASAQTVLPDVVQLHILCNLPAFFLSSWSRVWIQLHLCQPSSF